MISLEDIESNLHKFPETEIQADLYHLANHIWFRLKEKDTTLATLGKEEIIVKKGMIENAIFNWAVEEGVLNIRDIHSRLQEYAYLSRQGDHLADWFHVFEWLPQHICDNYLRSN